MLPLSCRNFENVHISSAVARLSLLVYVKNRSVNFPMCQQKKTRKENDEINNIILQSHDTVLHYSSIFRFAQSRSLRKENCKNGKEKTHKNMLHMWLSSRLLCCRHSYCHRKHKAVCLKASFWDVLWIFNRTHYNNTSLLRKNVCVKWVRSSFHCWLRLYRDTFQFCENFHHLCWSFRKAIPFRFQGKKAIFLNSLFACLFSKSLQPNAKDSSCFSVFAASSKIS